MNSILEIAANRGVPVVEDAAHAIGLEFEGRHAGTLGTLGCLSFFPSKNLGAYGDGGMVITDDDDLADIVRTLRVHGSKPKYIHSCIGGNFRLDALQAAVLRVKLPHLDSWIARRREVAAQYSQLFAESGLAEAEFSNPLRNPGVHTYHQYIVRTPHRTALHAHLDKEEIGCAVYYPVPLHLQECFAGLGYDEGDFPEAEAAAKTTLALPIYPELKNWQIRRITDTVSEFIKDRRFEGPRGVDAAGSG